MKRVILSGSVVMAMMFAVLSESHGDTITSDLGNTTSGFLDLDIPGVPAVGVAQGGQAAPFDQGYGTDGLFGGNFSQSWTHFYAAIVDPVASASITIGIYDHDSVASGSQLALFSVDGHDFTAALDDMFEAGGGALDGQYNVYTINLTGGALAALADGSATVLLDLQGPGYVPVAEFLGGGFQETSTNGANLIYSTLSITEVPEPGSAVLVLFGLGVFGVVSLWRRRRPAHA